MKKEDFYSEIAEILKGRKLNKQELANLKIKLCSKYNLKDIPTDIQILLNVEKKDLPRLKPRLVTKPTRTISGVAVVAVMTKPIPCVHGKCIYCPGGLNSVFGDMPQSYTGREPATMRAARAGFEPYVQVFNRIEQYAVTGHAFEKVELIVMGGTFTSFPQEYQKEFVMDCFKAMNDFSALFLKENFDFSKFKDFFELPGDIRDEERGESIQKKVLILKKKGKKTLAYEQKRNETARIRCIGLTIETRPDFGRLKEGNEMLALGCTRAEIGVQSVYGDVLKKIKRGHTVKDTIDSFRILKDLGFKINAHYMLGLPGSDPEKDLAGLKELFANPDFRPDMLKIYPCLVVKGTGLYNLWKRDKYAPISTSEAAGIIAEFKKEVPKYVRIMRVQRDIPSTVISSGVDRTNLRQYVKKIAEMRGIKCNCIRCREIGRAQRIGKIEILVEEYYASRGKEFFISAEDVKNNLIAGFCRMRFPSQGLRKEITGKTVIIRELHVYSPAAEIGKKVKTSYQHRGFGKALLKKAESIAKANGKYKVLIISGVGAREYYRKLGYIKEGAYMGKRI